MRKFLGVLCVLLGLTATAWAQTLTVDGFGRSGKQAEADALRNAVEKAVGVVVDSNTLSSRNALVEDNILVHSRGYITDYRVLAKKQCSGGWQVTVEATVDTNADSKLMSDLVRLGIIDAVMRNPRIGIVIFEERHSEDRAPAETALLKAFLENGFDQVVTSDSLTVHRQDVWDYDTAKLRILAAEANADYLVVGRASHSRSGDVGKFLGDGRSRTGMLAYRAQVDAKLYSAQTGRIIAADSRTASGADISEAVAAKLAVANAGQQLGQYFADQLVKAGACNRQYVNLKVQVTDFRKLEFIRKTLNESELVKSVQLRSYSGGDGVFQVQFNGSPEQLFRILERRAECQVILDVMTYDGLSIRAF